MKKANELKSLTTMVAFFLGNSSEIVVVQDGNYFEVFDENLKKHQEHITNWIDF